jgi:hypothetical protein
LEPQNLLKTAPLVIPPSDDLAETRNSLLSSGHFTSCVTKGTYVPWVQYLTDQASQRGVDATPTILVNGTVAPDATTVQGLLGAVNAAIGK